MIISKARKVYEEAIAQARKVYEEEYAQARKVYLRARSEYESKNKTKLNYILLRLVELEEAVTILRAKIEPLEEETPEDDPTVVDPTGEFEGDVEPEEEPEDDE